MPGVGSNADEG
ncbi:hypothetical protein A2U01_0112816, partial [Trifolium medium]|nr:hypothetical protein [Trifolium medium]